VALDFSAWILLGNFEKLLLRPLFVGITMLNGLSTRCAMYLVNENIVLPTAHTVTRAHAVSLSHTISTASRCNDAAVPAFCDATRRTSSGPIRKGSYYFPTSLFCGISQDCRVLNAKLYFRKLCFEVIKIEKDEYHYVT